MISRRGAALLAAAVFCTSVAKISAALEPGGARKPNIVLFFIDDLGWADLACYGSTFHETPHLDALAARGLRFTQAYAACPVCSPTRAALMTGKAPARLGITDWIGAGQRRDVVVTPENVAALPSGEVTFAEALKGAGYRTAYLGKWHLGAGDEAQPGKQGFDHCVGVNRAGQPASYFAPFRRGKRNGEKPAPHDVPDFEDAPEGAYLTDLLAAEAAAFVEASKADPFLLVLAHYSVHTPIQAKEEDRARFEAKRQQLGLPAEPGSRPEGEGATRLTQNNAALAAMVASVDRSVGKVLGKIRELGLEDDTLVIFTSDNGGLSTLARGRVGPGCSLPLRAGKGWLYEGGVRVPWIVAGAGVEARGETCETPVVTMDIYPTLLSAAGLPPMPEQHRDGSDLTPLLAGGAPPDREALFWHYPHYHGSGNVPSAMVRKGDYKLVRWYETGDEELYHLADDLGEAHELASQNPEKRAELAAELDGWLEEVGARMPRAPLRGK